ncbi:MAG: BlaI/MecI/CopY family transcriptional regulator [Bacteroidales bacterium]|nr:BlaI/MecI/CopY family transcriptional regulator [Bacteroidales bacterium]
MEKQKRPYQPTDSELEILQVLWIHGPSTVRFVNDLLNTKKKTGYTTTLKLMQIMTEKELLNRDNSSRIHIFSPAVKEEETQTKIIDKMLGLAFGGSASKLVLQTLGNNKTSPEELEKIKQLITDLEKKRK